MLVRHGIEDALGRDAAQQHGPGAGDEAAEPMHLGTRVVQRRNAQEGVVMRLTVMVLLHLGRLGEAAMMMQDGLGKARRAAREVDGGVFVLVERDGGIGARAVGRELSVVLGEGRAVLAHVEEQPAMADVIDDFLDATGELRAEHEDIDIGLLDAVGDFLGGVSEVERYGRRAALEDAEVYGQPLEAVHEQDRDLGRLSSRHARAAGWRSGWPSRRRRSRLSRGDRVRDRCSR